MPIRRQIAVPLAALLVVAGSLLGPANPAVARPDASGVPADCTGRHWVGAWSAAPSNAGHDPLPGTRPLASQTVRMVVRPTLGGRVARVRLSHRYGDRPARISHATVAVRAQGAAAVGRTLRELTFDGAPEIVLRPGHDIASDPVRLPIRAGRDLVVTLHLPELVARPTEHFVTNQTSYLSVPGTGDHASDPGATAFPLTTRHAFSTGWYFLTGLDVRAPRSTGALVAFGDSITDGFQVVGPGPVEDPAATDRNARYSDFLAARLAAGGRALSVLNSGISGNRVLADADFPWPYGASGLARFGDDVLAQPGVTDVVVMEGLNDLGYGEEVTTHQLVAGLRRLVRQARRAGLRVHLGTLPPTGGARQGQGHGSQSTAERRAVVNRWIRTAGVADTVIDFDRALRDPADPSRLRPEYDSGDHLHPSTAGYRAMARAVPLGRLAGTGC